MVVGVLVLALRERWWHKRRTLAEEEEDILTKAAALLPNKPLTTNPT